MPTRKSSKGPRRDAIGRVMVQGPGNPAGPGADNEWWPDKERSATPVEAYPELGGTRKVPSDTKRTKRVVPRRKKGSMLHLIAAAPEVLGDLFSQYRASPQQARQREAPYQRRSKPKSRGGGRAG